MAAAEAAARKRSGGSYRVKLSITATAAARGSAGRQDDKERIRKDTVFEENSL